MDTEGLFTSLQESVTGYCPEPDKTGPQNPPKFKINSNIIIIPSAKVHPNDHSRLSSLLKFVYKF
jgi:hypothetical protein